ncbi:MAG: AAA family ATPase [Nitrosopumilus sp.]|nr:AAA family ATPase [Nitrosopumilus sp.]
MNIDIVNSTEIFVKLDIEEARALFENFLHAISPIIIHYQGRILQNTGDGVLVSFEGYCHGLEACIVAVSIPKALEEADLNIKIRIGLHSDSIDSNQYPQRIICPQLKFSEKLQKLANLNSAQISESLQLDYNNFIKTKIKISGNNEISYTLLDVDPSGYELIDEAIKSKSEILSSLHQGEEEILGERKFVTSFFISFNEKETIPQENTQKICLAISERQIKQSGGLVIKETQDTIFAVFGAPVALEDHALRTCLCAYLIKNAFIEEGLDITFRIGINTGEVVVDDIGNDQFHQYDAIGAPVNLAARLTQTASPNEIQFSQSTFELVKNYIDIKYLGNKTLKGFPKEVETYALISVNQDNIRKKMDQNFYKNSVFINHVDEIKLLKKSLFSAKKNRGGLIAVVAGPGVGKTRLAFEFSKVIEKNHALCYLISSSAYEKEMSFSTLKTFLKILININHWHSSHWMQKEIEKELSLVNFKNLQGINAIISFLGGDVSDEEWPRLALSIQNKILFQSLWDLLLSKCQKNPLVLMFEDLHWCDIDTLDCLDFLVSKNKHSNRILFVFDYRPEFILSKIMAPYATEIDLKPLSLQDSEAMINILLPGGDDLKPLKSKVTELSEGVPFFLEEFAKVVILKEVVTKTLCGYKINKKINLEMPTTVQGIISVRIDLLSVRNKKILQQVSILGRVFPISLLRYLNDYDGLSFTESLNELEMQGFIIESALIPEREFTFNHAYVRDVVYNSILLSVRKNYHRQLVSKIERENEDSLESYYSFLAQHSFFANDWCKAIYYYNLMLPSGVSLDNPVSQFISVGDNVRMCFEKMNLTERKEHFHEYSRIMLLRLYAMWLTHDVSGSIEEALDLETKAESIGNRFFKLLAAAWVSLNLSLSGHAFEGYKRGQKILLEMEQAIAESPNLNIKDFRITIYNSILHTLLPLGKYEEFDKMFKLLLSQSSDITYTGYYQGVVMIAVARVENVFASCARARLYSIKEYIKFVESIIDKLPASEVNAILQLQLSAYYFTIGDIVRAKKEMEKTFKIGNELEHIITINIVSAWSAALFYYSGDLETALTQARLTLKLYKDVNYTMFFYSGVIAIEILARCGQLQEAIQILEHIINIEADNQGPLLAQCYRVKAVIVNLMNDSHDEDPQVLELLSKAEKITNELQCNNQLPYICLNYSEYYSRIGDETSSKQYYQKALDYFKKYDFTGWLEYFSSKKTLE